MESSVICWLDFSWKQLRNLCKSIRSSTMFESTESSPKPGAAALSNMALMKNETSIFKVPAVPRTIQKTIKVTKNTTVLDEDDYVEGIARIIQRDFFPDLEKLRAQNDFLEAKENKDYTKLREIYIKYSGGRPHMQPSGSESPATFETPNVHPGSPTRDAQGSHITQLPEDLIENITKNHSLDSYLAVHTSEDNTSFERLVALEDRRKATKLADQFEAEVSSAALADRALELPSIEQQADQTERPHELDTWRFKARNYIMYVPDGSHGPAPIKPELQHDNTRLGADPFGTAGKEAADNVQKAKSGTIGVDGQTEGEPATPTTRHPYVSTPSPRPGAPGDDSPLMTWGEIEGTPFRLDGGDTPVPTWNIGRHYRMLEWGARDRIGLQLAEEAAKKRRAATPRLRTPTPRTGTDRLATMSPAARKFASKHLLSPRLKLTSPAVRVHTATPKRRRTPLVARKPATPGPAAADSAVSDLTDNLLNINVQRRTKAQDFFK